MSRSRSLSAGSKTFDDIGLFGMHGFSRTSNAVPSPYVGLTQEWSYEPGSCSGDVPPEQLFDSWAVVGKDEVV